ncbi:MAG: hypothetical protein KME45_29590 [Stenomitos rutilans HA7619-LM2]|nr:hypothetical protein [Stenomitos rutilans HA7619-LM2]
MGATVLAITLNMFFGILLHASHPPAAATTLFLYRQDQDLKSILTCHTIAIAASQRTLQQTNWHTMLPNALVGLPLRHAIH